MGMQRADRLRDNENRKLRTERCALRCQDSRKQGFGDELFRNRIVAAGFERCGLNRCFGLLAAARCRAMTETAETTGGVVVLGKGRGRRGRCRGRAGNDVRYRRQQEDYGDHPADPNAHFTCPTPA